MGGTCGTFFLVLSGTAVVVSAVLGRPIAGAPNNSLAVGLTFGLTRSGAGGGARESFRRAFQSGGHAGIGVCAEIPLERHHPVHDRPMALAIIAGLVVWLVFGNTARSIAFLGATYPAPTATAWQEFLIEAIVTFFLVMVVIAVTTDRRVPAPVAAPAIGFALGMAVLIAGPISGGAVNPARALGPMIVAWKFDSVLGLYRRSAARRHFRRDTLSANGENLGARGPGERRNHRACDAEESGVRVVSSEHEQSIVSSEQ